MCKVLGISRSTYYAYNKPQLKKDELNELVVEIFNENQHVYGTRKLKVESAKKKHKVPRRRIARIMRFNGLVSVYIIKKCRPHKDVVNNVEKKNIVNRQYRQYNGKGQYEVIVSDLTYVRVGNNWNYMCILLDLHNREIIGCSCGKHKNAKLVYAALATVKCNLTHLQIFHTDKGSEFKNYLINDLLKEFHIKRSLSAKGVPMIMQ